MTYKRKTTLFGLFKEASLPAIKGMASIKGMISNNQQSSTLVPKLVPARASFFKYHFLFVRTGTDVS